MGACFSKVFNGCPLKIHCATSWINPDTRGSTAVSSVSNWPSAELGQFRLTVSSKSFAVCVDLRWIYLSLLLLWFEVTGDSLELLGGHSGE